MAPQHRLLDVAGVLQLGEGGVVAVGLVEPFLRRQHGLVRVLDLLAGVGARPVARPAAGRGLEGEDRVLDLVEPVFRGLDLARRGRFGQRGLDAGQLVVDVGPLAGQVAGDEVGLAGIGLLVERVERLAQRFDVDEGRLDARHQLGALVEDVLAAGGPAGGGLLDGEEGVGGLGLGVLGGPQLVAGGLELAPQRRLVELGGLEVAQLVGGVVDHLRGGGPLLLDEGQLVVRVLHQGPALLQGARRVGAEDLQFGGALDQRLAVGQVRGHAADAGGGLVAAAHHVVLDLTRPAQGGVQLALDAVVFLDPT